MELLTAEILLASCASQDVEPGEALFTFSYIQTSPLKTTETLDTK